MPDNDRSVRPFAHVLQDRTVVTCPTPAPPAEAAIETGNGPVASPCVLVCLYDRDLDACRGCFRSLDEIAHWSIYDPDEQRAVLARVAERRRRSGAQAPG
jgi:uncharacterized protein